MGQELQGMCLDLAIDGYLQDGTLLMLWECNGSDQQNWMWEDDGTIRSALNDQMCVDAPDGDPDNGRELWMWECNGGSQYWSYAEKIPIVVLYSMLRMVTGLKAMHDVLTSREAEMQEAVTVARFSWGLALRTQTMVSLG